LATIEEDRLAIRELVENWALWRDSGDWERFATVWHPTDGWMTATWFQGPAREFIAVSREGFERGVSILHFLGGHTSDVAGDRAIAQTKMTINQRGEVDGIRRGCRPRSGGRSWASVCSRQQIRCLGRVRGRGGSGRVPACTWCDRAASAAASQRRSCSSPQRPVTSCTARVSPGSASSTGAGAGSKSSPRSSATRRQQPGHRLIGRRPLGRVPRVGGSLGMHRIVPDPAPPRPRSSTACGPVCPHLRIGQATMCTVGGQRMRNAAQRHPACSCSKGS
jgi:hypothetical protein